MLYTVSMSSKHFQYLYHEITFCKEEKKVLPHAKIAYKDKCGYNKFA